MSDFSIFLVMYILLWSDFDYQIEKVCYFGECNSTEGSVQHWKEELMLTKLLFCNILTDLPEEDNAALLSCLVFDKKNEKETNLTPSQKETIDRIQEVARDIGKNQKHYGLQDVDDYDDQFQFGLVEVVYKWSMGFPIRKITELTDVQEGSTVKVTEQLVETLLHLCKTAQIIGNETLDNKIEAASTKIKRETSFSKAVYIYSELCS
ncbi:hypothetical protein QYM36_019846 [Artemia franciscana]|uniref:ATP-dependent RNA helicase Ski2/MTR4 C-terminal domain-containing protein n=1 Tax=Artemia franciscana TaxID=6661 RepID=A0AA88H9P1_ARTSF|nr:hypothetical protein QYM36_019846 [Artemia franciscana]